MIIEWDDPIDAEALRAELEAGGLFTPVSVGDGIISLPLLADEQVVAIEAVLEAHDAEEPVASPTLDERISDLEARVTALEGP